MSSTKRGGKRHASDYYITPVKDIIHFLGRLRRHDTQMKRILETGQVLDPCAGGDDKNPMSYPKALSRFGCVVDTLDIREDSQADMVGDYLSFSVAKNYDCIITNPPFSHALQIIEKAIDDVAPQGFVIMLLRLNFFGSKARYYLWEKHMPKYVYVHHARMSFTQDGGGDSIEYAHFVWQKEFYPQFTQLQVI
jgi:hypothetical protein